MYYCTEYDPIPTIAEIGQKGGLAGVVKAEKKESSFSAAGRNKRPTVTAACIRTCCYIPGTADSNFEVRAPRLPNWSPPRSRPRHTTNSAAGGADSHLQHARSTTSSTANSKICCTVNSDVQECSYSPRDRAALYIVYSSLHHAVAMATNVKLLFAITFVLSGIQSPSKCETKDQ